MPFTYLLTVSLTFRAQPFTVKKTAQPELFSCMLHVNFFRIVDFVDFGIMNLWSALAGVFLRKVAPMPPGNWLPPKVDIFKEAQHSFLKPA